VTSNARPIMSKWLVKLGDACWMMNTATLMPISTFDT
jgi:hypothetical protein